MDRRFDPPGGEAPPGRAAAFTLIEMLVVIAIIGILAAIAVPALNTFKPNVTAAATQQLMADLARARQLALSERTTVYMVFVPTNFYNDPAFGRLTPDEQKLSERLLDKQRVGYALVSLRSLGDQPGRHTPRYLSAWKTLPEGTFIPDYKFRPRVQSVLNPLPITNHITLDVFPVAGFERTNNIPFPTATIQASLVQYPQPYVELPYIAFNHYGQLTSGRDEIIPLARGNVGFAKDASKMPTRRPPTMTEAPPGNSTNSSFNLVYIDNLTGRAHAERQEIK